MASFDYQVQYSLNDVGGGNYQLYLYDVSAGTATDNDLASTTFAVNETIDTGYFAPTPAVGHYGDGFVVDGGGQYFLFSNDGYTDGTTIALETTDFTVCFLTGTMIATPGGERAVEALAPGDLVMTASGETRPVRWMGRQTVVSFFADRLRGYPVCIRAGALDDNVPHRDLHVSPDHAMFVDGVLAHAGALVNGTSIVRTTDVAAKFVYHHIELEDHALVLAEGAPAETFVDSVSRRRFDNHADYTALYGEEQPGAIVEHVAPRALSARQLDPAIRERLARRAEALGWAGAIAA